MRYLFRAIDLVGDVDSTELLGEFETSTPAETAQSIAAGRSDAIVIFGRDLDIAEMPMVPLWTKMGPDAPRWLYENGHIPAPVSRMTRPIEGGFEWKVTYADDFRTGTDSTKAEAELAMKAALDDMRGG